jgi:pimeloyl-ACP methyl ester carboxylesterase
MQVASADDGTTSALREAAMPAPLAGPRFELGDGRVGRITCYGDVSPSIDSALPPLLLVHSINAAATAYEMKPLFDHYRGRRAVYALDLPGFGLSDRSERAYTPRLMTDAIVLAIGDIRRRHGDAPVDLVALSLSCEFAARAATEMPNAFRTVALISPTGLTKRAESAAQASGSPDQTRAIPWLHSLLNVALWKRGFFAALTSRAGIRFFLQKTFGSKQIDEGLFDYDYITTHQPGAENAPYYFVSGYLFSAKALNLYRALAMPVWMAHGVRGDFVDYEGKRQVEGLPNWSIEVFETGALPHFEQPQKFLAAYEDFVRRAAGV